MSKTRNSNGYRSYFSYTYTGVSFFEDTLYNHIPYPLCPFFIYFNQKKLIFVMHSQKNNKKGGFSCPPFGSGCPVFSYFNGSNGLASFAINLIGIMSVVFFSTNFLNCSNLEVVLCTLLNTCSCKGSLVSSLYQLIS